MTPGTNKKTSLTLGRRGGERGGGRRRQGARGSWPLHDGGTEGRLSRGMMMMVVVVMMISDDDDDDRSPPGQVCDLTSKASVRR
jgi:hypothetical protein